MTFFILACCIVCLVLLITWAKVNPFLAFLLVSVLAGFLLRMPLAAIAVSVNKGIGDMLGSLVIVIVLGAMLGKLVAESGAAQRIAQVLGNLFGAKNLVWSMTLTGFIVGIPLFYNVGFVLLIPIIFSVAYNYKLPLVYIGLPMLASLSVMHGFLPPHPSPMALVVQFKADMATTFLYGMIIAIPAIVLAGPFFSRTLRHISAQPAAIQIPVPMPDAQLPGVVNSLVSSLLPVLIIAVTAIATRVFQGHERLHEVAAFLGEPSVVMTLALLIATFTLGIGLGKGLPQVMQTYGEAVKDIAMLLLIIGSAGILKQIIIDSGVSKSLAEILGGWQLQPLLLAWLVTAVLRLSLGSATVAGLTAAGILFPVMQQAHVDPNLMVLSIGAGSLFCSHVNDTAFWMFKEYFGLSMRDTFRSWTMMESLVSVIGLAGVLVLDIIL